MNVKTEIRELEIQIKTLTEKYKPEDFSNFGHVTHNLLFDISIISGKMRKGNPDDSLNDKYQSYAGLLIDYLEKIKENPKFREAELRKGNGFFSDIPVERSEEYHQALRNL